MSTPHSVDGRLVNALHLLRFYSGLRELGSIQPDGLASPSLIAQLPARFRAGFAPRFDVSMNPETCIPPDWIPGYARSEGTG